MTSLKAAVAIVVAAAGALVTALGTSPQQSLSSLSLTTWLVAIGAILSSGGVTYFVQNGPAHAYIKAVVAAGGALVSSLIVALNDNTITQAEWITAITAAILATGFVYQASNTPRTIPPQ